MMELMTAAEKSLRILPNAVRVGVEVSRMNGFTWASNRRGVPMRL